MPQINAGPFIQTNVPGISAIWVRHQGAFEYNGALYDVCLNWPAPNTQLTVVQSFDGGKNWLPLDQANAPLLDDIFAASPPDNIGVLVDPDAGLILFAYMQAQPGPGTGRMVIRRFNYVSRKWIQGTSATDPAAPAFGFSNPPKRVFLIRIGASYVVLYSQANGAFSNTAWKSYSALSDGLTWSAITQVCPEPTDTFRGWGVYAAGATAAGRLFLVLYNFVDGSAWLYSYPSPTAAADYQEVFFGPVGGSDTDAFFTQCANFALIEESSQIATVFTQYPFADFTIYALKCGLDPAGPPIIETIINPEGQGGQGGAGVSPWIGKFGTKILVGWVLNSNVPVDDCSYLGACVQDAGSSLWRRIGNLLRWSRFTPPADIGPANCQFALGVLDSGKLVCTFDTFPGAPFAGLSWAGILTSFDLVCPDKTARVGSAYSSTFTVSGDGGTPAYTFALVLGSLPPGLSLNASTGALAGTPTARGVYRYSVRVTDAHGRIAFASCAINVLPPLEVNLTLVGMVRFLIRDDGSETSERVVA